MNESKAQAVFNLWRELDELGQRELDAMQRGYLQGRAESAPAGQPKRGRPPGVRNRRKANGAVAIANEPARRAEPKPHRGEEATQ